MSPNEYEFGINEKLEEITLSIDNILLDPNNYRIIGASDSSTKVPEERIGEDSIQEYTLELMERAGDISPLIKSILKVGFLVIDKVVVRPWKEEKYMVIEGNRRIAALKKFFLITEEVG